MATKPPPDTKEMKAVAALLGAMHDMRLDGAKVREAMEWALGFGEAIAAPPVKCLTCGGHGMIGGHSSDGSWDGQFCPDCNVLEQPAPQPRAAELFPGEDRISVPLGLIGAACSAIDRKRDAPRVLAELRRYTFGDLSKAAQPATQAGAAERQKVLAALIDLARIVDRAVEDWGESFADGSSEVRFHKEEADKRDAILDYFDSLPDGPDENVIERGPLKAARIMRAHPTEPSQDATEGFVGYLCCAWGESDRPVAELVRDLESVGSFMVREWLGAADAQDYDGTPTLPRLMTEWQDHDWDNEWSADFEIGGVSVERLHCAVPAARAAKAQGEKGGA